VSNANWHSASSGRNDGESCEGFSDDGEFHGEAKGLGKVNSEANDQPS